MPEASVKPEALAAALAARLVHDLSNTVYGVTSGLGLHAEDDSALKAEGLALAAASAEGLVDLLAFCRVAFGGADGAQGAETLERLARTQFAGKRGRLVWSSELATFGPRAAQGALILAQVAAGGLPHGGTAVLTARQQGRRDLIRVEGEDARARLQPEAVTGLAGEDLSSGLAGRWGPSRYLHAIAQRLGGAVSASTREGGFTLELTLPGESD
jgi:histidine phosphotransferase ChpT